MKHEEWIIVYSQYYCNTGFTLIFITVVLRKDWRYRRRLKLAELFKKILLPRKAAQAIWFILLLRMQECVSPFIPYEPRKSSDGPLCQRGGQSYMAKMVVSCSFISQRTISYIRILMKNMWNLWQAYEHVSFSLGGSEFKDLDACGGIQTMNDTILDEIVYH